MYSIAYIVPYFGKLPKEFRFWLLGAASNPSVHFIIFTDDKTNYNFPNNCYVYYFTFYDFVELIEEKYDFNVVIERPYKLCDFRPAYGEIFSDYLKEYDFWGYCDLDMIFGDIRKFFTDDLLSQYDRIGCQGHSTIYKNNSDVNRRYKSIVNEYDYKNVFTSKQAFSFDEVGMDAIYSYLNIPFYKDINYVHLTKFDNFFFLALLPHELDYKNENQIFTWQNGTLLRHYIINDDVFTEEYMYLHYWLRPTIFKIKKYDVGSLYVIYPDITTDKYNSIDKNFILKHSHCNKLIFYFKCLKKYKKKLSLNFILNNIKGVIFNYNNHKDIGER